MEEPLPSSDDKRSPFERDRARIIHSAAFRRLQGKTQVYGLGASDYYRTRLTHSLEVAQIGKALALNLGADESLVEAICLAHDIGHPPFGHAAEHALHAQMSDIGGFNGNAQNLRILLETEKKSTNYSGLNLTNATLDGIVKYPQPMGPPHGYAKGYYQTDQARVDRFKPEKRQTFECQMMDWADDVAYSSHDLEDALVIGTVRLDDLRNEDVKVEIEARAAESYAQNYSSFHNSRRIISSDVEAALAGIIAACQDGPGRIARIKTFIGQHISDCVTTSGRADATHQFTRYRADLTLDPNMVRKVEVFKAITWVCVINTNSVLTMQQAGKRIVLDLYGLYSDHEHRELRYLYPPDWRESVEFALLDQKNGGDALAVKRLARDYIATMTDRFAEEQWRRLNLPGEGQLFIPRA